MKTPRNLPKMSVVYDRVLVSQKKGNKMDLMCIYCEGVFSPDTYVCSSCDEYKGLMPLKDAVEYLDLPIGDFPELRHA
jgi:hypothetical protein